MNTPPEKESKQESTVSIRSAHRWDTAFEGEVTDVHIDGTSLKMTTQLHEQIAENGARIAENGGKIDQNWKYYRDQHRKTRRLLYYAIALGASCFGIILGFWVTWAINSPKAEETRKALDQIDAIHKGGGGGGLE